MSVSNDLDVCGFGNGAEAGAAAPAPPLPCLNENKCSKGALKSAHTLRSQIEGMALSVGVEKVALLTVTTKDNCTDSKEFQRRWRGFHRAVKEHFPFGTWAREPQKRGAWHAHCAVAMSVDVRTGFDFGEYRLAREASKRKDRKALWVHTRRYSMSAHPELRKLWTVLRGIAKRYGFGRVELVPIENASKLGHYLADYLAKGMGERRPEEKGVRLWGVWGQQRWASTQFAWQGPGGMLRRRKLRVLQEVLGISYEEFPAYFGRHWSHKINQLLDVLILSWEQYPKSEMILPDLAKWGSDRYAFQSRLAVVRIACTMSELYTRRYAGFQSKNVLGLHEGVSPLVVEQAAP